MSYNGSGTFVINTAGQPVVTGTPISSTVFNALTADLATGLSTAITKDGQTATTARIPFAQGINSTLVTDSTSTTTGSIITAGGAGVAKALFVGTTANVAGAVTLQSTLGVTGITTFSAQPIFSSLTASSAVATDASKGLVSVTNTGTGNNVLATSPTLVTPVLGAASASSLSNSGNLTFTGTGNRITGDFSNATVANRVAFQSSTGTFTIVPFYGPGANQSTSIDLILGNAPTDTSRFQILSSSVDARLNAGIYGTGTYVPMTFFTGGSERVRIDTSGNVGIGTSSPSQKLDVVGAAQISFSSGVNTYQYFQSTSNYVGRATDGNFWVNVAGSQNILFGVGASEKMRIDSSGIVTMSAYGAGAATFSAAGVISSVSDETWKIKDGVPVDTDAMLNKLEPGYWYYNDEKKETFGTDRQLGFYAQNVNAAIGPEAAPTPEEGKPWGYYDRSVLAITVMSLQKALATIESLTARITALESN
jgi:hypothetical protein